MVDLTKNTVTMSEELKVLNRERAECQLQHVTCSGVADMCKCLVSERDLALRRELQKNTAEIRNVVRICFAQNAALLGDIMGIQVSSNYANQQSLGLIQAVL